MKQGAWQVRNFTTEAGEDVILTFLRELNATGKAKGTSRIIRQIKLLREFGLSLGTEHLHKVDVDLWELRATWNRNPYRIMLYHAGGGMLILLSAFHKTTNALTPAEKQTARRRMNEHQARTQR